MQTGKRFLVTGGAGFIGSNFIRFLYERYPHDSIVNVDALTYAGNLENLIGINSVNELSQESRYDFLRGDITNPDFVRSVISGNDIDYLVHFAAETHVDRSYLHVADFIKTNIEGTRLLIDALRELQPNARFIHISTDEIYGSVADGFADEDAPIRPSNLYAASKASADLLVQAYMKSCDVPGIIVRGSNNFGPFQYPEKLIPLAITNLIEGKKIPVHGSGEHIRSWLHVSDFCAAIDRIARDAKLYSAYNVSGEQYRNIDVLGAIASEFGISPAECIDKVPDRPGADMRYAPDSTKIRTELGWRREYDFISSLPETIDWYRVNSAWWKDIKATQEYKEHYEKQSTGVWY